MCFSTTENTKTEKFRSFRGFRVQIKFSAQSIFATSTKVRHLLNKIKILSLCLFLGLCLWQIPADASSPFLRQAFGASQENEPSPSVSHYGKTKYGTKIAPCGRKKSLVQNCLEDSTIRNPVSWVRWLALACWALRKIVLSACALKGRVFKIDILCETKNCLCL